MTRADYATIATRDGEAASDLASVAMWIETDDAREEDARALWRAAVDLAHTAEVANRAALGVAA